MKAITIEKLLNLLVDANGRGRGRLDSEDWENEDWREVEIEFWRIVDEENR